MKWTKYSENFIKEALINEKDEDYIEKHLDYAKNLFDKDIPIIYDQYHLSLLVGYEYDYLLAASNASDKFYRNFEIPKKNGKMRAISEPLPSLKEIQHWILDEILNKLEVSKYAKAYVKGKSIKDNARFHRNQKIVATFDIKDFFPNINICKIINIFQEIGYTKSVSVMLGNLCCVNDSLPQGAPTSAILSNLVLREVDDLIAEYTNINKIRYTRYADDLTFSGQLNFDELLIFVKKVLKNAGFKLNCKKTRRFHYYQRQIVTGIVTNKKLQAPKKVRKQLRQEIYYIHKFGLNSHLEKTNSNRRNYLEHLLGISNFILHINPNDKEVSEYKDYIKNLIMQKNNDI